MVSSRFIPHFPHLLSTRNSVYQDYLQNLLSLNSFDWATDRYSVLYHGNATFELQLKSKNIVLAGLDELIFLFGSKFKLDTLFKDGDFVSSSSILTITGDCSEILKYERFIVDLVSSMSSVSTNTRAFSELLDAPRQIAATRKSLLSLLYKKAVSIGGGITHRINLDHAVIFKDTSKLRDFSSLLEEFMSNLSLFSGLDFVEFEIETDSEFKQLVDFIELNDCKFPIGIMFDNFDPQLIAKLLNDSKADKFAFIEVSGGISLNNLPTFNALGIDIVSSSQLYRTNNYPDFSLELLRK